MICLRADSCLPSRLRAVPQNLGVPIAIMPAFREKSTPYAKTQRRKENNPRTSVSSIISGSVIVKIMG